MKIIQPKAEIIRPHNKPEAIDAIYKLITFAGGTSYLNEKELTPEYTRQFVKTRINEGHESVLEHASMTVRFTVDRGVSHELVRHRLASITQESSRYCNYSKNKFGNELTFIEPFYWKEDSVEYKQWKTVMQVAENCYISMLKQGATPEQARAILPNSLKTTVTMTCNMREWRTIFKLRAAGETGKPHPQMLEVMVPLLKQCQELMPELFGDIGVRE